MKLSTLLLMVVLMKMLHVSTAGSTCYRKVLYPAQETYQATRLSEYVSYTSCGWWGWKRCRETKHRVHRYTAFRDITKSRSEPYCCNGYHGDSNNCQPICPTGCYNGGTCTNPNVCTCVSGWTGGNCKTPICSPECHHEGTCVGPNTCRCNPGWRGSNCKTPYCPQGCNGGNCTSAHLCTCSTGWTGADCRTAICSQGCHNGGHCVRPSVCRCSFGWTGSNCTTPICLAGCYNGGTCTMPEFCTCNTGWTGRNCKTPSCLQRCHHGGTCIGPNTCSCSQGWTGSNCTTPYCSQGCYNGGNCTSPYICTCSSGWTGADCKIAQCTQTCYNGGVCIKPNICGCRTGWTGNNCTTPHCPQGCYNGRCEHPNRCTCNTGWTGVNCTIDINECTDPTTCGYNQRCINIAGSYKCECLTGYEPDPRFRISTDTYYHCIDTNECEDDHGCSQICNNQAGSFSCGCMNGYVLQADQKQCQDINECIDNNAGCDHTCVNTPGSYYCKCNSGYVLHMDKHNCTDIMECSDGSHNCSQICIELQGEFSCACYGGYELLEDGVSCKEINLCETGTSGCQHLCIKTNGSFYCDCLTGYHLLSDNMTCEDINECDRDNGGCSQICNNTFGSYRCSCKDGYTLDFNGFNCTALPCPHLMDPRNGQYTCDGDGAQVTGTVCRLKCNRGYKLVGAKKRECLSTNKWSENDSFCEILHCDELNNPENASIILPCVTELGTTCRIVCSPGYYTNSTNLTQECNLVNETATEWSEPPQCIEKQLCNPNPCKHNGTCIKTEESTFVCECDGVGYTGKTCDILLIDTPEFSTLSVNSQRQFTIYSSPDREFTLHLVSDDRSSLKVVPSSVTFSPTHTYHNVTLKAEKPGKYTLKYRVNEDINYQSIPPVTILVTNSIGNESDYFNNYGVKPGILKAGCCSNSTMLETQCSSSNANLFLKSTCGWIERVMGTFYSPGIVFISDSVFDMPIAVAGAKVRKRKFKIDLLSLKKEEFDDNCSSCSAGSSGNVFGTHCNVTRISLNNVQSFLNHEALASTYFHHSLRLIPKWLKLNALSSNRTHNMHSYIVNLVYAKDLRTMSECSQLMAVTDGLYSVMVYSGSLGVKIGREFMKLQTTKSSGFCFAVNLCEGKSSSLYTTIPDEVQTVLQSLKFMRDLKNKGWNVTVNSLVISDSKIHVMSDQVKQILYWNGNHFFTSSKRNPSMLTNVKFTKLFSKDDTVKTDWIFSGNVHFLHDNINKAFTLDTNLTWDIYFNGFTRFTINVPVYGDISSIKLVNDTEPTLLLNKGLDNNVTCHGCSAPSGIAFKLVYNIVGASTGLFHTLLAIPQKEIDTQLSCPLDSFAFLNNKHDLEAVSIMSSCLGIKLGLFPIYGLETHIYIFNKCKIDHLCTILNYTDANIIVWNTFPNALSELSLGHFIELLPVSSSNRTGLVATFSKDNKHLKAILPNIRISLFDISFKTVAIIDEQQFTFSKPVRLFGKYRVKLSGNINQLSIWDKIAIQLHGEFYLNNPSNIPVLLCNQIATYIDILYNRSKVEMNNAEVVYNRAVSQFIKANMTYNKHKVNKNQSSYLLKQMEDEYKKVNNTLYIIKEKLQGASTNVKKIQEDIDNLCIIRQCPEVCIPQQICKECQRSVAVPIQGTCIFQCTKTENITVITGTEIKRRWNYEPQEDCNVVSLCLLSTCRRSTTCVTNYISIPVDHVEYITEVRVIKIISNCNKPCSETIVTAPVTALCCANLTCNSTQQDIQCLSGNQNCTQTREIVYSNLDAVERNATEILRSLDEAKRNETVAKLRLLRSKVNYNSAEKKFNESKRSYIDAASTMQIAMVSFEEVKNKVQLAKLEKVKNVSACGFTPPSFLEIKSVSFEATIITESPSQLAVDVLIHVASENITLTETIYIDFTNIDASIKQGAVAIIENLVLSPNTVFKRHSKRAANMSASSDNEIYFQKKCADVDNIIDYINELNTSIFTIAASTASSLSSLKDNVLELSKLINYSSSVSNEEFTVDSQRISDIINRNLTHFTSTGIKKSEEIDEVIKLMQEYVLSSQQLESELDNTLYQSWQAKMEDLHNQTKSAAGFPCIGFSGCLQKIVDTLNDLVSDIPLDTDGILSGFSNASQSLMDLALLQNYSIVSAVTNAQKIYNIASNPVITDYWCASAPRIIIHPIKYLNATENTTIELSCKAEVDQFTSYQWKKDGIQLVNQKNSTLVLTNVTLSESGNYTCVVTNQIGHTNSFNATVEVLRFPSFFLEPQNTNVYLGNLNGATFQCNATGFPNPGYKWYFQPKGENGFNEIPNSNQNVLVIVPPLPKDEGSYYCEAFIGNESVQSKVANLTVLQSTVVQIAQTVYLNFSYLSKVGETETHSSGSGSELTLEEDMRQINNYITNDFSGSGSGDNEIGSGMNRNINITITPYRKLTLERNLFVVLSTLMSFGSTTVENVSLSFVNPFNLMISFTLYSRNISYSEDSFSRINQLAPQALMEWAETWQNLQELFSVSGFIITDYEYEYESVPSSLTVDMLQLICPAGKEVQSTNNLICANCPPGSYQVLDVRRIEDENGQIVQYIASKCVSCPVGYYQNEQGHDTCKQCPPGYVTLTSGASQCLAQCSPGKYSQSGLEPCLTCSNETHSFINGSTTCYNCSDENYQLLCPIHKIRYCPQGCYNNGSCISPYTCVCSAGWTGFDCNTGSTVTFSQLTYSIAEDSGPLQPILILNNSLLTNVTVQVVDSNNTAVGGIDYNSGPYNITFPAGVTIVSFNISIHDDDVLEDRENFTLTINSDSLPDGITTDSPSKVTVIIRNDDTECAIPKLDVVFVLDVSVSIKNEENFEVMKDFVKNTADLININLNDSLAAVVLFGGNAWIQFSLTQYTDKNSFLKAVDDLKYKKVRQIGTNTPDALNLLRIAGQDGRLGLRNDTVKIVVLITDGRPNLNHLNISLEQAAADTEEAATKLHDSGVYDQVYSVGIEGTRPIGKLLNVIANPSSLVYHITGFDATLFQQLTQSFTSSFCNDGTKPPQ